MIGQTISHYKILEKLGEGGMGIVYKAHDTELDRVVALKFLPHYLTTDSAEKERFHHEARAASALNHPNITTIYEIKEFENQLYLAMELVEGKTLKRLIEQETLSMKKILEVAIQACEGLTAAHEKGIVHRDIKSDNIMMTPKGQVKIMDFGLAKVKGATKLTKTGSTVGTAAYMSPEQAQGEEVDQRSDIFSFGVVLYELLTTKLPFRGEHQAAIVYSLINEEPAPIARFNEKVGPEIERIVSKALAKDPDDRYQHVDDLLADLRRERKHIEYARAGYAKTPMAAEPPPGEPTSSAHSPAPSPAPLAEPPSPLPAKKKLMKYVLPASVLIVLALLLLIFNPFNFQISPQKSAATPGKSSLAVVYFENIPDPTDKDHTGEMLTNLLTTSLFQARDLEVISRERLLDIEKELGQAETRTISPSAATTVAQRAGVSMMLLGSILQKEPSLVITYRLVEVSTGKILSTQRLAGFSPERIFSLVDTLALLVKNDLSITPSAPAESKSVMAVTTSSPEAYRSFLEGVELVDRYFNSEAKAAFRRSIELDSNFAMAYFGLANLPLDPDESLRRASLMKAWGLIDRVTEKERLAIQAQYASEIENDQAKRTAILEELLRKYPHEQREYVDLANSYARNGQFERAIQTYQRAIQNDPRHGEAWNALAYIAGILGRKREAIAAIDQYQALAPALPNPYDSKADIYGMFNENDSSLYWFQRAVSFKPDFPSAYKIGYIALLRQDYAAAERMFRQYGATSEPDQKAQAEDMLALIPFRRGRLQEAERLLRRNLESYEEQRLQSPITTIYYELMLIAYQRRDFPSMIEYARKDSSEAKKVSQTGLYGLDLLALAYLKNGNREMFSKLVGELKNSLKGDERFSRIDYEYTLGVASFEDGKFDAALDHFQTALQTLAPNHLPLLPVAVAHLKTGRAAEAIEELKRITACWPIDFPGYNLFLLPKPEEWLTASVKAHYWLGVAYEQDGRKADAVREYEEFLNIWKDADFKSQELEDARARLGKLKATG
ncbi:MAG TPA: protein kinase [Bacteroidota bacterium]|nr:protein kinase [Bacteroidota bacterium]